MWTHKKNDIRVNNPKKGCLKSEAAFFTFERQLAFVNSFNKMKIAIVINKDPN